MFNWVHTELFTFFEPSPSVSFLISLACGGQALRNLNKKKFVICENSWKCSWICEYRVGGQPASQPQSFVVAPIGCYKSPVAKTEIWNLVLLRHDSWKGRWKRYARRFELKMQGGFSQILLQFQCWDQIINPHHEIAQVLSTRVEFSLGLTWEAIVKGESAAMWWWGCLLWLFVFRTLLAQNTEIIQGPNS